MKLIEVFKTNITTERQAKTLVALIRQTFPSYEATFDLDDCDNILRIATTDKHLHVEALIGLAKNTGAHVEILPDEIPPFSNGEMLLSAH